MRLGVDAGRAYVKVAEVGPSGPNLVAQLGAAARFGGSPDRVVLAVGEGAGERAVANAHRAGFHDFTTLSLPRAVLLHLGAERRIEPGRVLLCDVGAAWIDLYLCLFDHSVIYVLDSEHRESLDLGAAVDRLQGANVTDRRFDRRDRASEARLRKLLAHVALDEAWGDTRAYGHLTTAQIYELVRQVAGLAAESATLMRERLDDFGSRPGDLLVPLGGAGTFSLVHEALRDALGLDERAVLLLSPEEVVNAAAYGAARVAAGQDGRDRYPLRLSVAAHRFDGAEALGEWLELAAPGRLLLGGEAVYARDRRQPVLVEDGHQVVVAVGDDPFGGRQLTFDHRISRGEYHLGVRVSHSGHGELLFTPANGKPALFSLPLGILPASSE
ncbi:hypothetical protein ACIBQ1_35955 [Nonomuraea sp. NPDC050153]|uniref:hypothetical protein n=1 Tax=Nonomuraea sp. NPDC050153 TaxID=3364359 RepID=UPI0037A18EBC